ncbi:MAG TPA: hypothetical protein VMU89_14730 [Thermomicrobiaceae bacterium]|nr:hypothetical protein [Thermomicrobiaceae bacterium]
MALSFIKDTGYSENVASATMALTPANTIGNLLVLSVGSRNAVAIAPVSTVADTGGNTWTKLGARTQAGALDEEIWWTVATAVCGTLTVTFGGTSASTTTGLADVQEWHSTIGWPASPPDASVFNGGAASTSLTTGNSPATGNASEVSVAMALAAGAGTFSAQTAGYTTQTELSSAVPSVAAILQTAYKILAATGVQSYGCTHSASTIWEAALATFAEATAPTFVPRPIVTRLDRMHSKTQAFSGSVQRLAPAVPPPSPGVLTPQIAVVRSYWTA